MAEYDTLELAEDAAERGSLPNNDVRFSVPKILKAATVELRDAVAPLLSSSRAEHLVYKYTLAVTSGVAEYRMPPRAIGGSLRDVAFYGTDGNPVMLRQLSMDEVVEIGGSDAVGTPYAYFTRGYVVRLVPTPNIGGTLSLPYYARPNKLVIPSDAVVATGGQQIGLPGSRQYEVFTGVPPVGFQVNGMFIDVVRGSPGFETLAINVQADVEEVNPGIAWVYRFTMEDDIGVVAGDYVCMPGEAPVPQVPVELHGLLAVRTARRLVKAAGDDRWQALESDCQELEEKAKAWLSPRVAGDTQQAGGSIGYAGLMPMGGWGWGGF